MDCFIPMTHILSREIGPTEILPRKTGQLVHWMQNGTVRKQNRRSRPVLSWIGCRRVPPVSLLRPGNHRSQNHPGAFAFLSVIPQGICRVPHPSRAVVFPARVGLIRAQHEPDHRREPPRQPPTPSTNQDAETASRVPPVSLLRPGNHRSRNHPRSLCFSFCHSAGNLLSAIPRCFTSRQQKAARSAPSAQPQRAEKAHSSCRRRSATRSSRRPG